MADIIYPELSYVVQGAYMDVYRALCPGISEALCEEALALHLTRQGLPFERQKEFFVFYKGTQVGLYITDLIVDDKIVLELKSVPELLSLHTAQLISYLKVTGYKLGILMNFGGSSFEYRRVPNYVSDKAGLTPTEVPSPAKANWLYPQLVGEILNTLYEVHSILGPGFLHQVYRRATWAELRLRKLPVTLIKSIDIIYQGELIGKQECRLLKVDDRVLVAAVAIQSIAEVERQKFRTYLKWLSLQIGLLANFHEISLRPEVIRV